jgi:hypothetical protein
MRATVFLNVDLPSIDHRADEHEESAVKARKILDLNDFIVIMEIRPLSTPKISKQQFVKKQDIHNQLRMKHEKSSLEKELFMGEIEVISYNPQTKVMELYVTFNGNHSSWDYSWKSNRWSGPNEQHVVDIIVLKYHSATEFQVCSSHTTNPFIVISSHKRGNGSHPLANIEQPGKSGEIRNLDNKSSLSSEKGMEEGEESNSNTEKDGKPIEKVAEADTFLLDPKAMLPAKKIYRNSNKKIPLTIQPVESTPESLIFENISRKKRSLTKDETPSDASVEGLKKKRSNSLLKGNDKISQEELNDVMEATHLLSNLSSQGRLFPPQSLPIPSSSAPFNASQPLSLPPKPVAPLPTSTLAAYPFLNTTLPPMTRDEDNDTFYLKKAFTTGGSGSGGEKSSKTKKGLYRNHPQIPKQAIHKSEYQEIEDSAAQLLRLSTERRDENFEGEDDEISIERNKMDGSDQEGSEINESSIESRQSVNNVDPGDQSNLTDRNRPLLPYYKQLCLPNQRTKEPVAVLDENRAEKDSFTSILLPKKSNILSELPDSNIKSSNGTNGSAPVIAPSETQPLLLPTRNAAPSF